MIKELLSSLVPYTLSLLSETRPVFLYGMGDGAEKIYKYLTEKEISVRGVVCSDDFFRDKEFLGYKLVPISEAEKTYGALCLIVCFGLEGEKTKLLSEINKKHRVVSPNLPVFGDTVCDADFISGNAEKFEKVYSLLADEKSKDIFVSLIKYNVTGDIKYLDVKNSFDAPKSFFDHALRHIDVGAYDGDTALWFYENSKNYSDIAAFEPDIKNYKKLLKNISAIPRAKAFNFAVGDKKGKILFGGGKGRASHIGEGDETECISIDDFCGYKYISSPGTPVGSIKIDAEGMDEAVICGAVNTLYCCKSSVCVALYHRGGDIIDLPLLLHVYDGKYKFYLRKKEYIPAWDVFLYAVRGDRKE